MKCPEVKHWLYGLKPRSSWPVELVRHLKDCPRCLKLRTRLAALDHAVDEATKAPVGEAAKARVAAAIQELPQQPGKPAPRPAAPRRPRWVRWGAFAAGAAALVAFGMLVGPHEPPTVETRTVEVVREAGARAWAVAHPHDVLVVNTREAWTQPGPQPLLQQRFRARWIQVWRAGDWRGLPAQQIPIQPLPVQGAAGQLRAQPR